MGAGERGRRRAGEPGADGGGARSGRLDVFCLGLLAGLILALADRPGLGRKSSEPAPAPLTSGRAASSPLRIPWAGWRGILVKSWIGFNADQIPAVAAGITFFGLLALFPALAAFVSVYGLVADVEAARRQILALQGLLPGGAVTVLGDQMLRLTRTDHAQLGLGFAISLVLSIWSANAGVKALLAGLNVAYDAAERRKFLALNAVSLGFTLVATLFAVFAIAAVAAAPATLTRLGLGDAAAAIGLMRGPLLVLILVGALSLLYRYGPCRARARWRWVTPGGVAAALGWVAMSLAFSGYVGNFGRYDATYGSLGAVVGFMTWIWLSLMVILLGAELNAQIEREITVGAPTKPPQRATSEAAVSSSVRPYNQSTN